MFNVCVVENCETKIKVFNSRESLHKFLIDFKEDGDSGYWVTGIFKGELEYGDPDIKVEREEFHEELDW